MISYLKGTIEVIEDNKLVILTQSGVGYGVSMQAGKLASLQVGQEIILHTYLKVAENALELFGFETLGEKNFFEILLSVKGIGPRGALNILGLGSMEEIKSAIARNDSTYLTQVSGMGKKTAERLCVELKNKVDSLGIEYQSSDSLGDVVDALVSLGYSKEEARLVVKSLDAEDKTSEQLVKEALKSVGK